MRKVYSLPHDTNWHGLHEMLLGNGKRPMQKVQTLQIPPPIEQMLYTVRTYMELRQTHKEPKPTMQPTKTGNDYRFWTEAVAWWHEKAEQYLALGDDAGMKRCLDRAELALMNREEVTGKILVYGPEIYARPRAVA